MQHRTALIALCIIATISMIPLFRLALPYAPAPPGGTPYTQGTDAATDRTIQQIDALAPALRQATEVRYYRVKTPTGAPEQDNAITQLQAFYRERTGDRWITTTTDETGQVRVDDRDATYSNTIFASKGAQSLIIVSMIPISHDEVLVTCGTRWHWSDVLVAMLPR